MAKASAIVGIMVIATIGFAFQAMAQSDDFCPWGGDRSQALKCFDCMKRVWTGRNWRLVNTCKNEPVITNPFQSWQQPGYR